MKENYNEMDINKKLLINLRDIGHMIRCLYEGKGSQKRILIILYEEERITQCRLTDRLGIRAASVSEVIKKLEKAELIERKQCQQDKRTTILKLTSKGREEAYKAFEERRIRHQQMFSGLSYEEKEALLYLTEKLNNDWDTRYRKE